jgi:hypothetical protein
MMRTSAETDEASYLHWLQVLPQSTMLQIKTRSHRLLLLASTSLFLVSCQSPEANKEMEEIKVEHSFSQESGIQLNNGLQWMANAETTDGIGKMLTRTKNFSQESSHEEYIALSDSLNADFSMIFKKCTMKGEAHNQLHNYLLPMRNMMRDVADSSEDVRLSALDQLQTHLSDYGSYFQ